MHDRHDSLQQSAINIKPALSSFIFHTLSAHRGFAAARPSALPGLERCDVSRRTAWRRLLYNEAWTFQPMSIAEVQTRGWLGHISPTRLEAIPRHSGVSSPSRNHLTHSIVPRVLVSSKHPLALSDLTLIRYHGRKGFPSQWKAWMR